LNREYKPVGFFTRDHVTYADYPVLVKLKGLTPALASKLSWNGSPDTSRVYLYNDGTNPVRSRANMQAYLDKIQRLAKLGFSRSRWA